MIRALILALALAACAPSSEHAQCDVSVDHDVAFSAPNDHVTARAFGASCDKAVALYVITSPEGHPIWSWTSPMARAFGDQFNAATQEQLGAFLAQWSEPKLLRTSAAPVWSATIATELNRTTYEDVRARNLPMLCHLSGVARETCLFWEPAAAAAAPLLERDTAESVGVAE